MEYIKKNWARILLAVISFVGALLMLVPLFTTPSFNFIGASQIIGAILFFLGIAAYYILKALNKENHGVKLAQAITLISTGLLSLIFLVVGAFGISATIKIDATTHEKTRVAKGPLGSAYSIAYEYAYENVIEGADTLSNRYSQLKPTLTNEAVAKIEAAFAALSGEYDINAASAKVDKELGAMKGKLADLRVAFAGATLIQDAYLAANDSGHSWPEGTTKATATAGIAKIVAGLDDAIDGVKGAQTIGNGLLMTYISLILLMGLFPIVRGAKKLACVLGGCTCGEVAKKAAPAPVAAPAVSVAAPVAPVAKPAAKPATSKPSAKK